MTAEPADLVLAKAEELLACLETVLSKYDAEACRTFIAPGNPPAWDVCCDCGDGEGQAYVQIASVAPTDNFPATQTGAMRCPPSGFAAQFVVGIIRCAAVVDDQGRPPSSARLTADAVKVHRDRAIVQEVMRCCYLDDADPGSYVIGTWTPLGPQGGCVGGSTPILVAVPACRCPDDDY